MHWLWSVATLGSSSEIWLADTSGSCKGTMPNVFVLPVGGMWSHGQEIYYLLLKPWEKFIQKRGRGLFVFGAAIFWILPKISVYPKSELLLNIFPLNCTPAIKKPKIFEFGAFAANRH